MAVEIKSDELQWIAEAHPSSIAVVSRLAISHPRANRERLAWAAALLSSFLMNVRLDEVAAAPIRVVLNWAAGLRAKR